MPNADYSRAFLLVGQIGKLLDLVLKGIYTTDVLIEDAIKLFHKDRQTVNNSFGLLVDMKLISTGSNGYLVTEPIDEDFLKNKIISRLKEDQVVLNIAKALKSKNSDGSRDINQYRLFPKFRGVLSLVTSLGMVNHDSDKNIFVVPKSWLGYFEDFIEEGNLSRFEKGLSPEQLQQQQFAQNQRGEAAEDFVLACEKVRLRGHPNIDAVKRISLTNVSAGFDIQSFGSIHSTNIDKFIEVKSYVGEPGFYWSINEIKFAQKMGTQYCLVIVNSGKLNDSDYNPPEIINPYDMFQMEKYIGDHTKGAFEVTPMNFYISAID